MLKSNYYSMEPPIHDWVLENTHDAILFVNEEAEIIRGNQAAYNILGITRDEMRTIDNFFDFNLIKSKKENHHLMEIDDNSKRIFQISSTKVDTNLYCMILNQISLNNQTRLMRKELNNIINKSFEGMVLHEQGKIIDCDATFASMFGFELGELIHKQILDLLDEKSTLILKNMLNTIPANPFELTAVKKNGTSFFIEVMEYEYPFDDKNLKIAIIRDITDRVQKEKQIEFMAYYDELTDLPNRNFFNITLKEAIAEAKEQNEKLAIHFMDVDYFKQINDTLGYTFGDELLKACSARLKQLLDENNFIARMGSDEFLILQRGISKNEEAEQFAKKIIQAFQEPVMIDDFELFTSVSIGISIFPDDGYTPSDLIKHADSAMYVIKGNHRNDYKLFNSSITENFKMMLTMETELRRAFHEGLFELHYQPQKNLKLDKIVGLEALLRWKHPEKGYISPSTFIPLAEKTGLIIDIGNWVLREACRQNKRWQDEGFEPMIVSVNFSAKQIHQRDLVENVSAILEETGLQAQFLEIEITESIAMTNEAYILVTLQELRKLGVRVSIDDFGTGYSSLMYLSQFPVSKLKIDKVFINENKKQNEAIVKSIIHMSHSLEMQVIAEGVETLEQLEFLQQEQCDEIQGFYFCKPLPPQQLVSYFK